MSNTKKPIVTDQAPSAIGPYSQAVAAGGFVFASGQLGLDPATGEFPSGVEAQAKQSLENVRAVLEAAGSSLDRVVKATMFLKDMNDFAAANAVYGTFFNEPYPARSTVEVARLPKDALVEVEVIALVD
ncbi:RidA family protein [Saccharibacillus alkalitolerans]|uniref:RidA family protein n=1 Tax=Saccharibacillus alkalitolerans TaxID=2705290 RepID=A0ABX0FBS8_9BACL|nr:RidA family protein [Saccharibacillus alkalitolerans]NGZ77409.1 RidA family protein [Saccharibacillus alkalitolerans]